MNTPNPLLPQGSLHDPSQGKSTLRIAVFSIIAIHAVFFTGILMQGCKPETPKVANPPADPAPVVNELPKIAETTASEFYTNREELPATHSSNPPPAETTGSYTQPDPIQEPIPSAPLPPMEAPGDFKDYTIVRNDSFWKIAKAQGVTVGDLVKANPDVDASRLKPGQKLRIPPPSTPSAPRPEAAGGSGQPGGATHTVRAGETLTKIARQHGVSVKALKAANNLRSDRVNVGQKLKVPPPEPARSSSSSSSLLRNRGGARVSALGLAPSPIPGLFI